MSFDSEMDEILEIFLEESFEGLDVMETGLLNLDIGAADEETINDIFRAAHSIKGGAGTLGYMEVSEFTHGVETLLDEIRAGKRTTTAENVQLLLKSVDHMRAMLNSLRDKEPVDTDAAAAVQAEITAMLGGADGAAAEQEETSAESAETEAAEQVPQGPVTWHIEFRPHHEIFQRGNDPVLMLRELAGLGELAIAVDYEKVPPLAEANVESCYLAFSLRLTTEAPRSQIEEVFEWVTEECDLSMHVVAADAEVAESSAGSLEQDQFAAKDVSVPIRDWHFVNGTPTAGEGGKLEQPPAVEQAQADEPAQSAAAAQQATNANAAAAQGAPVAPPGAAVPAASAPDAAQAASNKSEPAAATAKASAESGDAKKPAAAARNQKKSSTSRESASIRVSTEKVDTLLNLVGEIVITQSMLRRFGSEDVEIDVSSLRDGLLELERHTRELQESVMQIRMLPISFCFSRFPRLVHDLSLKLGKKIDLKLSGQQTELDKTVLEKIGDPLVHLVRNSLDHGIESIEKRVATGKPETGTIELSAYQEGGNIVIQVADDGAGLNRDRILEKARDRGIVGPEETLTDERIYNLIFAPGFSTAEQVSDVSGRGVGMDVVRRNIHDLGGRVDVQTQPGRGSVFTIRLPLTLAILDGQLVRVGSETFVVSLLSIVETVQVKPEQLNSLPGRGSVYRMRDRYIPVVDLLECFGFERDGPAPTSGLVVVVEADGQQLGLFVDELLDQQQVVIKSLEENFRAVEGLAGATILGDGTVALILDIPGVSNFATQPPATDSQAA